MFCIAVGANLTTAPDNFPLAEMWDGTKWTVQSIPRPPQSTGDVLYGVSCGSPTSCMAVGVHNASTTLTEHWNGTRWSVVPDHDGIISGSLMAVSCPSATYCVGVGDGPMVKRGPVIGVAETWNGSTWTTRAVPTPAGTFASLFGVSCSSAAACMAVGYSATSGPPPKSTAGLALRWNGSRWSILPTPHPKTDQLFQAVSCTAAATCTTTGYYHRVLIGGIDLPVAEQE